MDKIIRQAITIIDPDVFVTWWESGRVSQVRIIRHIRRGFEDGRYVLSEQALPDLPHGTPFIPFLYFTPVIPGEHPNEQTR